MTSTSSPQLIARLAGFMSLCTMAAGISAEFFVFDPLLAPDDAAATAANILAADQVYRFGFAAGFIDYTFYLAVTVLLYFLLRPVNRTLALLAAAFSLAGTVIVASAALFKLAPLAFLSDAPFLDALAADQLQALALLSLKLRGAGANIGLIFFGIHLIFVGVLIARSTFLPRILGVLSAIGGICFLVSSFAIFLAPSFADNLFPYILIPGILGQGLLALWLLTMGVNAAIWRGQSANYT